MQALPEQEVVDELKGRVAPAALGGEASLEEERRRRSRRRGGVARGGDRLRPGRGQGAQGTAKVLRARSLVAHGVLDALVRGTRVGLSSSGESSKH
jgi:hypothetical protein